MFGLRGPCGLDMVNQALRKKIAYWAEKEKENARDRSVSKGSDNKEELVLHNVEKRALCCSGKGRFQIIKMEI